MAAFSTSNIDWTDPQATIPGHLGCSSLRCRSITSYRLFRLSLKLVLRLSKIPIKSAVSEAWGRRNSSIILWLVEHESYRVKIIVIMISWIHDPSIYKPFKLTEFALKGNWEFMKLMNLDILCRSSNSAWVCSITINEYRNINLKIPGIFLAL